MNKEKILKSILYGNDVIKYVQKYMEVMNTYYKNEENKNKDRFSYEEYEYFKKVLEKGAIERGFLNEKNN